MLLFNMVTSRCTLMVITVHDRWVAHSCEGVCVCVYCMCFILHHLHTAIQFMVQWQCGHCMAQSTDFIYSYIIILFFFAFKQESTKSIVVRFNNSYKNRAQLIIHSLAPPKIDNTHSIATIRRKHTQFLH